MTRVALPILFSLALAMSTSAQAGEVQYVIPAKGVSCGGSAAHAEQVVRSAAAVESVEADPTSHSVTTTFDDETVTLAAVVESLATAGFEPGEPRLLGD